MIKKHVPMRACFACRLVRPKRELIRLVCTPEGTVLVDTGGKKAGRGAYLCRDIRCWELGFKKNHLEHCLRTSLSPENREELYRYRREIAAKEPA